MKPGTRVEVRCGHRDWDGITGTVIEPLEGEPRPNKVHFRKDGDELSTIVIDDDMVVEIT